VKQVVGGKPARHTGLGPSQKIICIDSKPIAVA
jgi:hypothetical protein